MSNLDKLWSRNYEFMLFTNLVIFIGLHFLSPTLPAYMKQIGGTDLQVSLAISTYSFGALLARPFTRIVSDRVGRKFLLSVGIFILAISTVLYSFSTLMEIILVRVFQGLVWGLVATSVGSMFSEIVPETRRGEGIGYYSLSMIISMSLTPLVAILIMNKYGFNAINIMSVVLFAIGLLSVQGVAFSKNKAKKQHYSKKKLNILNEMFEKQALIPTLLSILINIPFCGLVSYIMIFGKEIGIGNIWVYFAGHSLMILITRTFIGKLFDKKGHVIIVIPGAIAMLIGLVILSYVNSVPTLIIASLFYGLGYGAVQPSLQAWAINKSPADRKIAATATFLCSVDLGFIVGSMLLSFIAKNSSYTLMYRFSAIFVIVFLLMYGYSISKDVTRRNSKDRKQYS
jgi:MFS family permease